MKFDIIVADPPWAFGDNLQMSDVARGAEANYSVLDIDAIKTLKIKELGADNSVLALWVPSSLLQEGLDTMMAWGFRQTQTHVWVKIKLFPLEEIGNKIIKSLLEKKLDLENKKSVKEFTETCLSSMNFDNLLSFGMGRLFRQTHEICLIGVRGKVYNNLKNKSQRSVHFDINKKHSEKPEILQNRLELMFPKIMENNIYRETLFLEMFARRSRPKWFCMGNESPDTYGEDIRDSIDRMISFQEK